MHTRLWKFRPPKNMKRQSAILTGPALALLTATSGSPKARVSQIRHNAYTSTLLHLPSTHAEVVRTCSFVMSGQALVRSWRSGIISPIESRVFALRPVTMGRRAA
jgi:hypothetical protein